jgi:DNA-binding response OmpR family regulator
LKEHRPRGLRTILVLTGDVTPDRTAVIREMGVDGLMHKPINPEALVRFLTERRAG